MARGLRADTDSRVAARREHIGEETNGRMARFEALDDAL